MEKLKFDEIGPAFRHLSLWLADECAAPVSTVLAATLCTGELCEAEAFLRHWPRGSQERTQLVDRLRMGGKATEGILDCIRRAAPGYLTILEKFKADIPEMIRKMEYDSMWPR